MLFNLTCYHELLHQHETALVMGQLNQESVFMVAGAPGWCDYVLAAPPPHCLPVSLLSKMDFNENSCGGQVHTRRHTFHYSN